MPPSSPLVCSRRAFFRAPGRTSDAGGGDRRRARVVARCRASRGATGPGIRDLATNLRDSQTDRRRPSDLRWKGAVLRAPLARPVVFDPGDHVPRLHLALVVVLSAFATRQRPRPGIWLGVTLSPLVVWDDPLSGHLLGLWPWYKYPALVAAPVAFATVYGTVDALHRLRHSFVGILLGATLWNSWQFLVDTATQPVFTYQI